MLAVPSWTGFDLEAHEPTDLFRVCDTPVLEALGLYRENTLDRHQDVS
jgi:gentisate 1,2-dioxygenase